MIESVLSSLVATALWGTGGWAVYHGVERIRLQGDRWFWGRFAGRRLHIVFVEYQIDPSSHEETVAQSVGDGYQLSKGMALAVAQLASYCQAKVTKRNLIRISGDKTSNFSMDKECPICLGSKNNLRTAQVLSEVEKIFAVPFDTQWDSVHSVMYIEYLNNPRVEFRPNVIDGHGTDYALVVCAETLHGPLLVVAGAHMWGSRGAISEITDSTALARLRKKLRSAVNFAFVIEVTVVQNEPQTCKIVRAVPLYRIVTG